MFNLNEPFAIRGTGARITERVRVLAEVGKSKNRDIKYSLLTHEETEAFLQEYGSQIEVAMVLNSNT